MLSTLIKCLVISFLLFSCRPKNEDDDKAPSYVLSEEQFITVLSDCYLSEGASIVNIKNVAGIQFDSVYLFNPLKDNGVSKATFDSTISYYSKHPKQLKIIYTKVLDKLSQFQAKGTADTLNKKTKDLGAVK